MIPKTIAYGWFGRNPKPQLTLDCIASWRRFCPGYEIVELNESMVDLDEPRWVIEAREQEKWAFVADFYRMAFMHRHGGITLDADVELLKPLDRFLSHDFFSGQEINGKVLITATMGSVAEHPFVDMVLDYYRLMPFKQSPNTKFLTNLIRLLNPASHTSGSITFPRGFLYPQDTFCPYDHRRRVARPTANTYAIHHFAGSWLK